MENKEKRKEEIQQILSSLGYVDMCSIGLKRWFTAEGVKNIFPYIIWNIRFFFLDAFGI